MFGIKIYLRKLLKKLWYGPYSDNMHFFPRVKKDEIYLISYPRSGNTWVRCVITQVLRKVDAITPELVQNTIPDIYFSRGQGNLRKPGINPLIIKNHAPFHNLPCRVILLVRDGRDSTMSLYYYLRNIPGHWTNSITPQEFFFRNDHQFGFWHDYYSGWIQGLSTWSEERYLVIKYEDICNYPLEEFTKILNFTGISTHIRHLEQAIITNSKDRMKALDNQEGDDFAALNYVGITKCNWKTVFSEETLRKYEEQAGTVLKTFGYQLYS